MTDFYLNERIMGHRVAEEHRQAELRRLQEALDVAGEGVALSKELGVYRSEGALYAGMGFARLGLRRAYYNEPVESAVVLTLDPLP